MVSQRTTNARLQIAGDADLDGNLPFRELLDQVRVLVRRQTMADALGAQIQRAPDRLRTSRFSRVGSEPEAVFGTIAIDTAEQFRGCLAFVATDPKSNDVSLLVLDCQFGDTLGLGRS